MAAGRACALSHASPAEALVALAPPLLAMGLFLFLSGNAKATAALRKATQPALLSLVARGQGVVLRVQHSHCSPAMDVAHKVVAALCGVDFYITFLPLLFWTGFSDLAFQLTSFMALCIYAGNVCKDVFCTHRPKSPPVRRVEKTDDYAEEYGLPSTHTVNTVGMMAYLYVYLCEHQVLASDAAQRIYLLASLVWCLFMAYGRVYLGMHTPLDLVGGVLVAFGLLWFWCSVEHCVRDVTLTRHPLLIVGHTALALTVLYLYPTPQRPTPSKKFAVYFLGVTIGIVTSRVTTPVLPRVDVTRWAALGVIGPRMVVGVPVLLLARATLKSATLAVGRLLTGTPKASPTPPGVVEAAGLVGYFGVGFAVNDAAARLFLATGL